MIVFNADYYNGESSKPNAVTITINAEGNLSADSLPDGLTISDIDIRPRIGNTPRKIYLPNGAYLESNDNDILDEVSRRWRTKNKASRAERFIHKLESRYKFVLIALVATIAVVYAGIKYGIPVFSEQVAHWLPYEVDQALGKNVLPELDKSFFKESGLSIERKQEIENEFERLLAAVKKVDENHSLKVKTNDPRQYQIVFRASPVVGANAFALPDGTVVMTDELVELVGETKYLSGIILHEIAHVKYRHSLQALISRASFSALVLVFTGDISFASSLVLLLPSILLEAEHSRQFEYESDTYALAAMQYLNIPTGYFAVAMEKFLSLEKNLESSEGEGEDKIVNKDGDVSDKNNNRNENSFFDYFSTHPPTQERIDRFRNAE